MVSSNMKGNANAAAVAMTTQSRDRHASWTSVNRCILNVLTYGPVRRVQLGPWVQDRSRTGWTYLTDVAVVRVVFGRHQQQDEALRKLDPVQGHHTHVEEDPKQDRQRDLTQNLPYYDGQT